MGVPDYRNGSTSHRGRRGRGLPGQLQLQTLGVVLLVLLLDIPSSQGAKSYCTIECKGEVHTMCKYPKGPGPACGLYKRNYLTQEEKDAVLGKHNELRNDIALGVVPPFPAASNMKEMEWDNELERIAQRWADQCTFKHDKCRNFRHSQVGQNIAVFYTNGPNFATPVSRVQAWYDEISLYRYTPGPFTFSKATGHFTQIVWASTSHLGCARSQYVKDKFTYQLLVCNYNPAGNIKDRPLYSPGQPCRSCQCSSKYRGLCSTDPTEESINRNADIFSSFSPEFSTPNALYFDTESIPYSPEYNSKPTTVTTPEDVPDSPEPSDPECPQASTSGVACGSEKLAPLPLSSSDKAALLRVHNKWRGELARGGVDGFPPAADMEEMEWDEELADLAQRWANQCIWGHDPCRKTSRHEFKGQNIALSYGTYEAVEQRALEWFDEARIHKFTDTPYQYVLNTSHFSQMAWAETYLLGCARARFPTAGNDANMLVCNYGPGGNVIGRKIFTPGQPCSQCRRGSCSSVYPSLCTSKSVYQTTQRPATFYTTTTSRRFQQPTTTYSATSRRFQQPTTTRPLTTTLTSRKFQQSTTPYANTTSPTSRRFQQPTTFYTTTSPTSRKFQQSTTSYTTTTTLTSRKPQQPVTFFATTTSPTPRKFQQPKTTYATTSRKFQQPTTTYAPTTTFSSRRPQPPATFYATSTTPTTRRLQQPQQANELEAGLPAPPFVRSLVCPRPEGPGPACGDKYRPSALSTSERDALLAAHNDLRNQVASGLVKKMPSAANMNQLEWDDQLAKLAQIWSDQCTLGYDTCARTEFYQAGQNMAVWFSHDIDNFPPPQERVNGWFKEIDNFYYNNGLFSFNIATSALTQMLWASTRNIGCGRARFVANNSEVASELIVCNYGPGGNIIGRKIYQSGTPCSQCETGTQCSLYYPALCSSR